MGLQPKKEKQQETDLRRIIEGFPIPAFTIGSDHRVIHWNRALEKLSGIPASEVIGTTGHWKAFYTTGRPCMVDLLLDGTMETAPDWYSGRWTRSSLHEEAYEATVFFGALGEQGKWVRVTAAAIRNPVGDLIGAVETIEDVTERKQAEEELKRSSTQLRNLSHRLQSLREEERTLIAREIHDELGQQLSALQIDLTWIEDQVPAKKRVVRARIRSMEGLVDTLIRSVQRIATELRPSLLDDLGLSAAIEWQAKEFQKRTGIECRVFLNREDIKATRDRSTAIFRTFQETLTNVLRHAQATRVEVRLMEEKQRLILEVRDNGRGIPDSRIASPKSLGLVGIRERVNAQRGNVRISGAPGRGTTVRVELPLRKKA
jgi:signal transduction histidine kinase